MMTTTRLLLFVLVAVMAQPGCSRKPEPRPMREVSYVAEMTADDDRALRELAQLEHQHFTLPDQRQAFLDAAQTAWAWLDRQYQPATGLFKPVAEYPFATIWDIASGLAALYCAKELGFIDDSVYEGRLRRALATLSSVPLHAGRIFNKSYDTRTGNLVGRRGAGAGGAGWSTTDLGRLLIWLKIIATHHPQFGDAIDAIVRRNDLHAVVRQGYLWGEDVDDRGRSRTYQEGRIGYEQYAAHGFALWNLRAEKALRLEENSLPILVMGQPLLADFRGRDRLTAEPLLLLGLEMGWDRPTASLAANLLRAQEARYRKTGVVTLASEDAIDKPPHYFYYYCAYANGKEFGVDVQDPRAVVDGPRWVSAKAAIAYRVLMPNSYTDLAWQTVREARSARGWGSGVFERAGATTGTINVNTAAVIMTAVLVERRGGALMTAPSDEG